MRLRMWKTTQNGLEEKGKNRKEGNKDHHGLILGCEDEAHHRADTG